MKAIFACELLSVELIVSCPLICLREDRVISTCGGKGEGRKLGGSGVGGGNRNIWSGQENALKDRCPFAAGPPCRADPLLPQSRRPAVPFRSAYGPLNDRQNRKLLLGILQARACPLKLWGLGYLFLNNYFLWGK